MRKVLLFFLLAIFCHQFSAKAQSTCAQTLRLAQSVYEQGRLQELEGLLAGCLDKGFTDEEKVNAYKLLTLTYIYLEEPEKADRTMLSLLQTNNEFEPNDAVDPAEFVALYHTFRTWPVYRIGLKFGSIASQPTVVSADYVNDGTTEYKYGYGFTAAVAFEITLAGKLNKLNVNPEPTFTVRNFSSTNRDADSVLFTTSTESQTILSLPISLQYKLFEKGKTNVFVSLGASADLLLNASKRIDSKRGDENSPVEEKSFNVTSQRNKFNANAIASAGFKRKVGKGYFIAEVRYQMGLLPMLTKADTYENLILVTDYKSVDGIYKVNSLSVTLGYILNRYNPKKLSTK